MFNLKIYSVLKITPNFYKSNFYSLLYLTQVSLGRFKDRNTIVEVSSTVIPTVNKFTCSGRMIEIEVSQLVS